eukprot:INCI3026.1.p1 GENE.INCI3026.1~~INCI3026.1.p1  ORF type:complete len:314 (-),score=91.76 INCI3026.1:585-1526(-)
MEGSADDAVYLDKAQKLQQQLAQLETQNELFKSYIFHKRGDGNHAANNLLLTEDQKLDVVNSELDHINSVTEETRKSSEKIIDTLKAVIEETDLRISELRKEAHEFKRDIVVGAENFRTGATMAEKVIKYMEDKLRQKDVYVEKMKLKNASTRAAISKLEGNLKQKEEMGDVLHFIDFHQLQIENKQYVMKIEKRNQELIKLKVSTGKLVQTLNSKKKELHGLLEQSRWLTSEIANRKDQLRRVREENKRVADKMQGRKKFIGKLKNEAEESSETPQVIDYVKQKAEMYELETELKNYQRKVEIAEISSRQGR